MDQSVLEQLIALKTIDVKRSGALLEFEFKKLEMGSSGMWTLILNFETTPDDLDMQYDVSIVLNPKNYEMRTHEIFRKYSDPQKELFEKDDEYVSQMQKVHKLYENDANQHGIYDFKANVLKFERKSSCRQVKFLIGSDVAKHLSDTFHDLHRACLVLS